MQISIPAWYSDDLSQEVQQMSLQADELVPLDLDASTDMHFQLKINKGECYLPCTWGVAQHILQATCLAHDFVTHSIVVITEVVHRSQPLYQQ